MSETPHPTTPAESVVRQKYARGQHPNSRANLILFEPGVVTNHNGERGPYITPRIQRFLGMTLEELEAFKPQTVADVVALTYVKEAMVGGVLLWRGRQEVLERADGKVPDKIEVRDEPPAVGAIRELQTKLRLVK